jgi:hypothetical protein
MFVLDIGDVKPGIAGTRIPFQLTQPGGTDAFEFGGFGGEIKADAEGAPVVFDKGTVRPGILGNTRPP